MLFASFLGNRDRSAPEARRRTQTSLRQAAGLASRVESLEGRLLLSTLTVTSLQDSGAGSLRAEIAAAQSGDTIVFSATLSSSTTLTSLATMSLSAAKSSLSNNGHGNGHGKPSPPLP